MAMRFNKKTRNILSRLKILYLFSRDIFLCKKKTTTNTIKNKETILVLLCSKIKKLALEFRGLRRLVYIHRHTHTYIYIMYILNSTKSIQW